MTYNIWNGFEWEKDSLRKANTIEWIKGRKPDVLALQEMCGYTEDMLKEDALKWGHRYVVLLKTDGYPTALTSKRPIKLKEKIVKPFWHGLLHCETYGIDFYKERMRKNNREKYSNLRLGEFDYSVISEFLACQTIIPCWQNLNWTRNELPAGLTHLILFNIIEHHYNSLRHDQII